MSAVGRLPAGTAIGSVALAVADLDRSLAFWRDAVGFNLIHGDAARAVLGVGTTTLLTLILRPGAVPQPRFSTGLFHVAALLPTRRDLARTVRHVGEAGYSFYGASDHNVSEAFYLDDPDQNGVELYRDRPREQWEWRDGLVRMGTQALDVDDVLAELEGDATPWAGLPAGTRIGHVHLKVGDLINADRFYREVLGFDLTQRMQGALFFSASGYHHHVGTNVWQSGGAPPPPPNAAGLVEFTISLPASTDLLGVAARLEQSGLAVQRGGDALRLADPWGHRLNFVLQST